LNQPDSIKGMPWQLGKAGILSHHWRLITAASEGAILDVGKWWNPTGLPGDQGYNSGQDHTGGQAQPTISIPAFQNKWYHIAGAWMSGSDKRAWIHGNIAAEGANATAATPATPTETRMGVRVDQADGLYPGDQMAEVSVWNISTMSIDNIRLLVTRLTTLHNGLAPNARDINEETNRPWTGKLLCAPNLDKTSGTWAQDLSGNGYHYTQVGTLTQGADYAPVSAYIGTPAAGPAYSFPGV
jgi:hypothetical protein